MGGPSLCLFGVLLALAVVVNLAGSCLLRPASLDRRCKATFCKANKTCRAVKDSSSGSCPPTASCVKCIPIGADDVCNKNHYYYAVLAGDANDVRSLSELKCNMTDPRCPRGSTCLPDDSGTGTCCYGKRYPPPPGVQRVKNNDTVCPDKCGGCAPGSACKLTTFPCLIPPCPTGYRCHKIKTA